MSPGENSARPHSGRQGLRHRDDRVADTELEWYEKEKVVLATRAGPQVTADGRVAARYVRICG